MIAYLKGTLIDKTPQYAVIDAGGVGYRAFITLNCYDALPEAGEKAELHTITIAREDILHLYGFSDRMEKEMFLKLISVSRIGPKLACSILSGAKPDILCNAIVTQDKDAFSRMPGVGKKTAERLIMELKDKLEPTLLEAAPTAGTDASDAIAALLNLGYKETRARMVVSKILDEHPDARLSELIRKSLQKLSL